MPCLLQPGLPSTPSFWPHQLLTPDNLSSTPFIHRHVHSCVALWKAGRWREGERRATSDPPIPSGTGFSLLPGRVFYLCASSLLQRGRENDCWASGCHPPWVVPPDLGMTDCFYFISCHKTRFLGGIPQLPITPAFAHLFLWVGVVSKMLPLVLLPGTSPQQALGPCHYRLSRGNRNRGW